MTEQLLTRQQVADIFGVDKRTVDRWIRAKKINPIISPGRIVRIPENEIRRLLHWPVEPATPAPATA
jgi:excisionase family DNA binding protein